MKEDFWAGFGAEAKEWSKIVAGTILQKDAEKRQEERQIRAEGRAEKSQQSKERRQFLYGVDAAKFAADLGHSFDIKLKDYESKQKRSDAIFGAELDADIEEGFGNYKTAMAIDALSESDPDVAGEVIQVVQDIKADLDVKDERLGLLDVLGESASPILEAYAAKKVAREERERLRLDSVAMRNYRNALKKLAEEQIETLQDAAEKKTLDSVKYTAAQAKIMDVIKEIKESRTYTNLLDDYNAGKLKGHELASFLTWEELLEQGKSISQSLEDIYYHSAGLNVKELEEIRYRDQREQRERDKKARGVYHEKLSTDYMESGDIIREMIAPTEEEKEVRKEKMKPGAEKPFDWMENMKREDGKNFAQWLKDLLTKGTAEVPDDKMENFQAFVQGVIAKTMENLA